MIDFPIQCQKLWNILSKVNFNYLINISVTTLKQKMNTSNDHKTQILLYRTTLFGGFTAMVVYYLLK